MHPHRFDPISALFGLLAIVAGTVVAFDTAGGFVDEPGRWLAVGVLAVGFALVPWAWNERSSSISPDASPPAANREAIPDSGAASEGRSEVGPGRHI